LVLAERAPPRSPEQMRFLVEAQSAFQMAVRLWQAGVREDLGLYRPSLLEAGWLALRIGREDMALDHSRRFLAAPGPFPRGPAAAVRLRELGQAFGEMGERGLATKLLDAALIAEDGPR
jgi:hypothetical protein